MASLDQKETMLAFSFHGMKSYTKLR